MITNTISYLFPCENCTHRGICKYEDDVMSFVHHTKLPEQKCLSIKYECKYKTYTNLFGGYRDFGVTNISNTNSDTTSRPDTIDTSYTIDTSSKCIDKI